MKKSCFGAAALLLLVACSKSESGSQGGAATLSESRAKAALLECIGLSKIEGASYKLESVGPILKGEDGLEMAYAVSGKELAGPVDVQSRARFTADQSGKFFLVSTGAMSFCDDKSPLAVK